MEKAAAIIRFGIYITVLKNLVNLKFILKLVNQIAMVIDIIICGRKPIIQINNVLYAYLGRSVSNRIDL
jgi:hypothetical protein